MLQKWCIIRSWLQVIILARFLGFSQLVQKPLQNTSINTAAGSETRFWLQVIILARFLRFSFAAGPETYPEYNNQYSLRFSQLAQNSLQSTSSNTAAGSETRFWLQVIILARFLRFSQLVQKPLRSTSNSTAAGCGTRFRLDFTYR